MARLTLADGTRKTLYAKTRQEAARLLTDALRDRDKGIVIVGENQTVQAYLSAWVETMKPIIRYRTWQRYDEIVRLHILPTLGKLALARLTAQQVQHLYSAKLSAGLTATTVAHLHAVLHRALAAAVRLGAVPRNVCDLVDAPRIASPEMQVLTPEQARRFLEDAASDRLEALYVLALTTGMRRGELFALKWQDVDLDAKTLQVRASLQLSKDGYRFFQPKTKRSRRLITLTRVAVEALRRHHARQTEERLARGREWKQTGLVFTNTYGGPLLGSNLRFDSFIPLLQKAGLPLIRFHDLRHTAATFLLLQGVHPKVVSEMLGHASVGITLDLYSHVLPNMQKEATEALDRLLDGRPGR
jgi:integrase